MAGRTDEVDCAHELRNRLLGPLGMHFLAADAAYRDYLENGRSFLFACSLRRINASARELLLAWGHLLPDDHRADALALLRHYDVWLTLWDRHSSALKPDVDEPFAFENAVTFPKAARERLVALYERI